MRRGSIRSRKGVGTALGAAFFIIIVIISVATYWTITSYNIRYQKTEQKMTEWDTDRISEDLYVRGITEPSNHANYTFDVTIDNSGGVTVNVARIYVYDQINGSSLAVYDLSPRPGKATGFVNGTINKGEGNHTIVVKGTQLGKSTQYRIVLATDRGRQFGLSYPEFWGAGGGGGVYELVMVSDHWNFNYTSHEKTPPPHGKSAYVKVRSKLAGNDWALYSILLNNTTTKPIVFDRNSTMLQLSSSGGSNILTHYIVANTSSALNANPTEFNTQTINSHAWQYVYFAAINVTKYPPDPAHPPKWQDDPSGTGGTKYYLVGFILVWHYVGESTTRYISLPAVIQAFTD